MIDPGLMDLNGTSEDALEWDETDISNKLISMNEESNDLDQESQPVMPSLNLEETGSENPSYEEAGDHGASQYASSITAPSSPHVYQVYSLHNVELYEDSHIPFLKNNPKFTSMTQSQQRLFLFIYQIFARSSRGYQFGEALPMPWRRHEPKFRQ